MPRGKVYALPVIVAGLLSGAAGAQTADSASAPAAAPAQASPPGNATQAAAPNPARQRVAASLQEFADWVRGRGGLVSARIADANTGAVWAEASAQTALNPASNMKLLTAAVALERLGPAYCFSTGLYGKLEADRVDTLLLRGEGDPSLGSEDLWQLARALKSMGVARVNQILVDQSLFDDQFVPPGFEQQPDEWASFRAPVSAVALDRNGVTLNVLATNAGQPARAWFEPPGVVLVEGGIETRRAGSGEAIRLSLEPRGEQLVARVSGHVAKGLPRMRFSRRLDDPRRAPGLALRAMLVAAGIDVTGGVGLGAGQQEPRLVFHQSAPLGALLQEMGKYSDNFYAEMLFKALGREATAGPARSQDGARVVRGWLGEHGLLTADTRIENGSGLFDANRVSAATLTGTLVAAHQSPRIYPEFLAQLAIGGVDGTLRSRFRPLKEQRVVRAKTGTLAAAVGLSGYVLGSGARPPIAFSLLVNGLPGQAYAVRERMDRVVTDIAELRRATPR